MMKFIWSLLVLAVLISIASAMALTDQEFLEEEPEADRLIQDETDKRGFNMFMDPLSSGFANKRGFGNQFMDPLKSGFGQHKRFSGHSFMDPLASGFGPQPWKKRGFNSFMDPLKSGFGSYKRFQHFMDPLASGFHVKRDDE